MVLIGAARWMGRLLLLDNVGSACGGCRGRRILLGGCAQGLCRREGGRVSVNLCVCGCCV